MRPVDLDDPTPFEPDDETLARVRARSRTFLRRRTAQRVTGAAVAMLVVVIGVGVALTYHRTSTTAVGVASTTTTAPTTSTTTVLPDAIEGVWQPVSIAGYDGPLTAPPLGQPPVLRFDGGGDWRGSDGCHYLSGTYQLDGGDSLHLGQAATTKQLCAPHTPTQFLDSAARILHTDEALTFLAADGHELAKFERQKGVTARLELPSVTMTAGSSMKAHVIVENATGKPIPAAGCGGLFQIALVSNEITPKIIWAACAQDLAIPVGESNYPVTVSASYGGCTGGEPQAGEIACLPAGRPPPLPLGDYRATLFQIETVLRSPLPITVHVVAPG